MTNEELVKAYQDGNKSALDELLENNSGMVHKMTIRYKGFCTGTIEVADLLQEGNIGLIIAADKYDFQNEKKASFTTYAFLWIKQRMLRFLKQRYTGSKEVSLWMPVGDDLELADTLPDDKDYILKTEETIWYMEVREELQEVMKESLTLKQREVIELRYGFDRAEPATRNEVSEILGINTSQVRNLEEQSLRNIRRSTWGRLRVLEMKQEHDSR